MNIFFRELKANRKALIIWSVCMFLGVLSGMTKYTAYSSGANSDVFNKMPYTMKALFGFGSFDVTTISGFFAFLFTYIVIAAAIHAVLLGNGIVAKEERDKTSEFLMTKPVSRTAVITSKLSAAMVNVIVVNLVTLLSSIAMVAAYNKGKDITGEIVVFFISMLIIQVIFLSFGACLAALMKNPRASGTLAAGILFVAYMISKITDLTVKVNYLNILSPFKYFNNVDIVNGNGLGIFAVALSILLSAAFFSAAYVLYQRRDLKA
ncbi:MAG TPA: ABC transporter permease subunit [Clostridia bacterium]|nr:ABC transporter permease subunit [Clostridia bacterium]